MKSTMNQKEISDLLREAEVGHLATLGPQGPYVIPVHYAYDMDKIYFHCGTEGKKLENIKYDPRVCFQVEEMMEITPHQSPCKYNTRYRSVIVEGRVDYVTDEAAKMHALNSIVEKYKRGKISVKIESEKARATVVVAITPSLITGKKNI